MSMGNTGFIGEVLNVGVIHHRPRGTRSAQRVFGVLAALGLCAAGSVGPAAADPNSGKGEAAKAPRTFPVDPGWGLDSTSECKFGGDNIKSTPWSLQRILLDQLWSDTKGAGVKVAVIDSGVDTKNEQLKSAVLKGSGEDFAGSTNGTKDTNGHGTRVAGIIGARPAPDTGFTGIAPEADIIPIRYTGGKGKAGAGNAYKMADAIKHAVDQGAQIINISSDTVNKNSVPELKAAVRTAVEQDVLVVAAAGNDGADGKLTNTYPASYKGVVAVASSDRNNERAFFSQQGSFVDVAAPGVGMISTVPGGGQCSADGTSFSAPYVTGVAALMRAKYSGWNPQQIAARLAQTATRPGAGPDTKLGWGVVDPVAALSGADEPQEFPVKDTSASAGGHVTPMKLTVGESESERNQRISVYVVATGTVLTLLIGGAAIAARDYRRKQTGNAGAAGKTTR